MAGHQSGHKKVGKLRTVVAPKKAKVRPIVGIKLSSKRREIV